MLSSVWVSLRGHCFHLAHGHEWEETDKQQKQDTEETKGSKKGENIHHGRRVVAPAGGEEVTRQSGVHDDKSLKPHTDVDEDRDNPNQWNVFSNFSEPEQLRADDVAADHNPISPPVVSESSVDEGKALELIGSVPSDEKFHRVGVTHYAASGQSHFAHIV